MEWHVSTASAPFAAQLGCYGNQHILAHCSSPLPPPPPKLHLHKPLLYLSAELGAPPLSQNASCSVAIFPLSFRNKSLNDSGRRSGKAACLSGRSRVTCFDSVVSAVLTGDANGAEPSL